MLETWMLREYIVQHGRIRRIDTINEHYNWRSLIGLDYIFTRKSHASRPKMADFKIERSQ
jgi:hypothetical protein